MGILPGEKALLKGPLRNRDPNRPRRDHPLIREMLRNQGLPKAARMSWGKEAKENPDSPKSQVGYGEAQARYGDCEAALELLSPYVGEPAFDGKAADSAAQCAARMGYPEEALYYDQAGL